MAPALVKAMSRQTQAVSAQECSHASGEVAKKHERIPAWFAKKWSDNNLREMTGQLVNPSSCYAPMRRLTMAFLCPTAQEKYQEMLASYEEVDRVDSNRGPLMEKIGHHVADLPPEHVQRVQKILGESKPDKIAPTLDDEGRLRLSRDELNTYGLRAAMQLVTVVLNHVDQQQSISLQERYALSTAKKKRARAEQERVGRQKPKPAVKQMVHMRLAQVAEDLRAVDGALQAYKPYDDQRGPESHESHAHRARGTSGCSRNGNAMGKCRADEHGRERGKQGQQHGNSDSNSDTGSDSDS